jgi:hypothetical protein
MDCVSFIKQFVLGVKEPDSVISVKALADMLQNWSPSNPQEAPVFLDLSKRSLDEVTRLTGYEDDKANRILTAMAFLSALAGVLFASFVDKYHSEPWSNSYLVASVYLSFFLYVFTLALGAIFVVYAVKPRFNVPADWGKETDAPGSFLFFKQIIRSTPEVWAQAFTSRNAIQLQLEYARNSILETYLIAVKVRDKLAYLEPGIRLLWRSTQILFVWLVVYVIAVIFVPVSRNAEKSRPNSKTIDAQLRGIESSIQKADERTANNAASSDEILRRLEQRILGLDTNIKHLANQIESLKPRSALPSPDTKRKR